MIILKIIVYLFILLIVPEILGLLITRFMKEKNIFLNFLIGYVIEFSVLQLLAIPMIFLKMKYRTLLYSYSSIIGLIFLISVIINAKNIKNEIIGFVKNLKFSKIFNKSNTLVYAVILLIGIQIAFSILFTHNDKDDAFYIGTAVTSIYENNMYIVGPENGFWYGNVPSRYILAPFPMYVAIVSSITNTSPVIVSHTVLQPIFIFLTYVVYILIAQRIFKNNKTDVNLFLIFLNLIFLFGNISTRTNFTLMFFRIWQGKAILASILIPALWFAFSYCIDEDNKFINWFLIFLIILSSCLVTEMGIVLAPFSLMLLSIVFALKNKKISYIFKSMVCIIPCIVYLIIYFVIK